MKTYTPSPLNAENITLPDNLTELTEAMARNVHEVWALGRVKEGWKYGETRNDELKTIRTCTIRRVTGLRTRIRPANSHTDTETDYETGIRHTEEIIIQYLL